jgi:putative ABC transport system permease protein
MINFKHLFRLMWNRRKMNLLMIIEIFVSYLVIFLLCQSLVKFAFYYTEPLGFQYKNVWNLEINMNNLESSVAREEMELIKQEILSHPEMIDLSEAYSIPYTSVDVRTMIDFDDRTVSTHMMLGDDNYADVLEIEMIEGRWFDQSDNASLREPIIINRKLRDELFPGENAVGKILRQRENERIVVGVIDQIKKRGELNDFGKILFKRINPLETEGWMGESLLIKVKPGTDIEFEEKLMRNLAMISNNFTMEMRLMEDMRQGSFAKYSSVAIIFGIISIFLIINVSLGLFGVLWYNINFRRSEIGIRRSFGSTPLNIYTQIIGETLTLSTFSLILGSFIVMQLKILIQNFLRTDIFITSYIISVLLVYAITAICAFYPSKLAAAIEPAEALHDE